MRRMMNSEITARSYFFPLTFFGGVGAFSVGPSVAVVSAAFRFPCFPSTDFFVLTDFGVS